MELYFIKNRLNKTLALSEYLTLGIMLTALLSISWLTPEQWLGKACFLVHTGGLLMWSPLFKKHTTLTALQTVILLFTIIAFTVLLNWWLFAIWSAVFGGLLSGRVITHRTTRWKYGAALIWLISNTFLIILPNILFQTSTTSTTQDIYFILSFCSILALTALPPYTSSNAYIDLFHTLTTVIILILLMLSTIVAYTYMGHIYNKAIAFSLGCICFSIFLLTALWNPYNNLWGLKLFWEKYLLNVNTSFEEWVTNLSKVYSNPKVDAKTFIQQTLDYFVKIPGISGAKFSHNNKHYTLGKEKKPQFSIIEYQTEITVYSNKTLSPALKLHLKQLLHIALIMYKTKQDGQTIEQQKKMREIHEMGAKLTHDIKNILQSIRVMTGLLDMNPQTDIHTLLKENMTVLANRLEKTLKKFDHTKRNEYETQHLKDWWESFKKLNWGRDIIFSEDFQSNPTIQADVLSDIIDNLLENARFKRIETPSIDIKLHCKTINNHFYLEICDSGKKIPDTIAESLFKTPVNSEKGYGIGLLQSYKLALQSGYKLLLTKNEDHQVAFRIAS